LMMCVCAGQVVRELMARSGGRGPLPRAMADLRHLHLGHCYVSPAVGEELLAWLRERTHWPRLCSLAVSGRDGLGVGRAVGGGRVQRPVWSDPVEVLF
jgi:hypothetical protein